MCLCYADKPVEVFGKLARLTLDHTLFVFHAKTAAACTTTTNNNDNSKSNSSDDNNNGVKNIINNTDYDRNNNNNNDTMKSNNGSDNKRTVSEGELEGRSEPQSIILHHGLIPRVAVLEQTNQQAAVVLSRPLLQPPTLRLVYVHPAKLVLIQGGVRDKKATSGGTPKDSDKKNSFDVSGGHEKKWFR